MIRNGVYKRPKGAFCSLVLFILTLLLTSCALRPLAAHTAQPNLQAVSQRETAASTNKLSPYLQELAHTDPTDVVRVIVQHDGESGLLQDNVTMRAGTVVNKLAFINALVVDITADELLALAEGETVKWISLDAPVRSSSATDGSAGNVRDDFDQVAYDGSNGSFFWSDSWQEIGEADGPETGNVAVTTFWGGALQGLRLQGANTGATRSFALYSADGARMGLSFRRKGFQEQDLISLELSRDGGATWQAIAQITGPATDAEIQYADYTLPTPLLTTGAEQVQLRFVTAATMSDDARFYLDAVDVRLQLPATALNHQIYLPFVTGDEQARTEESVTTALTKVEELSRLGTQRSIACSYHCFNLNALASTYVEVIGADRLWNIVPYLRGWQVGVAVVDSGISPHPDLVDYNGNSRLIKQVNFVPGSATPDDFYGHGTHVAGTIGGIGQSSGGVYMGVAPESRLIDVRVTDDYGMGNTSSVVAGLEWIYQNRDTYNIKVANLSLNSTVPESYHQSPLNAAVEILWFNKIVVVVSAGNGGPEKLFPPANDPFVITVGSADDRNTVDTSDDKLSGFSAYGITIDGFAKPDIIAPGQNIVSLLASDDMNLKLSHPEYSVSGYQNKYFRMSGTSMASAVVAGAVAILAESNTSLTPDQIKYRLLTTAKPFTVNNAACATGAGYLDIYAAVHGNSTANANQGLTASKLLWTGTDPVTWNSVSWNSVSWNSVSWNSVSWNSVSWNSISRNSVSWNSNSGGSGYDEASCAARNAVDAFEVAVATGPTNLQGGIGWAGNWVVNRNNAQVQVVDGSLAYDNLAQAGNALQVKQFAAETGVGFAADRYLQFPIPAGEVWMTYRVNASKVGVGHFFVGPTNNFDSSIGKAWGNTFSIHNARTAKVFETGQTYLMVAKYVLNPASPDQVYLWVNPDLSQEPNIANADLTTTDEIGTIDRIAVNIQDYGLGDYRLDEIRLGTSWAHLFDNASYEAEAATRSGAVVATGNDAQGNQFVDYINPSGDYVEWNVPVLSSGVYPLRIQYANGSKAARPMQLSVNGNAVSTMPQFAPTGVWTSWATEQIPAYLNRGNNIIRLTATGNSGPNVDFLRVGTKDNRLLAFNFDFGTESSPVPAEWTRVSPSTNNDFISWSGTAVRAVDRGAGAGVNDINRDFVYSNSTSSLNLNVGNGTWHVTVNIGDRSYARDKVIVKAEGETIYNDINAAIGQFVYVGRGVANTTPRGFDVVVTDGVLTLEFADGGGGRDWSLTRVSVAAVE